MRMSDLRTLDHEPLLRASEWAARRPGGRVLPVWCFDPRLLTTSPFGFARLGVHRARFLLESVADLRARLSTSVRLYFALSSPPCDAMQCRR